MKLGILGSAAASMLIAASLGSGRAEAQSSQTVTPPKQDSAPVAREQTEPPQGSARKFSSEESALPIPAGVPKAVRVDPGK